MAWDKVTKTVDRIELNNGKRTAHREYVAVWHKADGPIPASAGLTASANGVTVDPYYSSYAAFPGCLATRITVDHLSPFDLKIVVDFSDPDVIPFDTNDNMLALPATIVEQNSSVNEEYTYDTVQRPVMNTAFEPFERGPFRRKSQTTFQIQKYITAGGRSSIRNAVNTINRIARVIDGSSFDKETLLLTEPTFAKVSGQTIYQANFLVIWNRDGWDDVALNVGWQQLTTDGTNREDILDAKGKPIAKPWPLGGTGRAKKGAALQPTDFETIPFHPYEKSDWVGVPLI